ncbi:MAG: BppU family phage baseplate upper protein [Turicibacter sp.]|nr:BppU family phage baseplate upper protein [Turicibacter sp.]
MNEIVKKEHELTINISPATRSNIVTNTTFFSMDVETGKKIINFTHGNEPVDLTAAKVMLGFEFVGTNASKIIDSEDGSVVIEDALAGQCSVILPNHLYEYAGQVLVHVYIVYEDGYSLDCGIIVTQFEESWLDSELDEMSLFYVQRFEDLSDTIKARVTELEDRFDDIEALRGPQGEQGPQGERGPAGERGLPGAQGERGPVGPEGAQGSQGERGASGTQGERGPIGPQGIPGSQGERGLSGPTGPQGVAGERGPQGFSGAVGPRGEIGPVGPAGERGLPGAQGERGPIGAQGPQGERGLAGATGPQGSRGETGPQGIAGPAGERGLQGAPGTTSWNGITDRPATFVPTAHTHDASHINAGTLPFARIPVGTTTTTVVRGDHAGAFPLHNRPTQMITNWDFNPSTHTVIGQIARGEEVRLIGDASATNNPFPSNTVAGTIRRTNATTGFAVVVYRSIGSINEPIAHRFHGASGWTDWLYPNRAASINSGTFAAARIPTGINITGNAATATTLQTARTINGTNFNGSANITTANWGTARNVTIGSTQRSVNGSANVAWSLADIGAAAASHTHNASQITGTSSAVANNTGTFRVGDILIQTGEVQLSPGANSSAFGVANFETAYASVPHVTTERSGSLLNADIMIAVNPATALAQILMVNSLPVAASGMVRWMAIGRAAT